MFDRLALIIGEERRGAQQAARGEDVINPAAESILGRLPHASAAWNLFLFHVE